MCLIFFIAKPFPFSSLLFLSFGPAQPFSFSLFSPLFLPHGPAVGPASFAGPILCYGHILWEEVPAQKEQDPGAI